MVKYLNESALATGVWIATCCRRRYSAPYLPIAKFVVRSSSSIFSAPSMYDSRISAQASVWSGVRELAAVSADFFLRSLMAFERSTAVGRLNIR